MKNAQGGEAIVCPEHPEDPLRIEDGHRSGFCTKCCRHYYLCTHTRFMDICIKLNGHEGKHKDARGREWDSPCPS